jgi:hypothetical protein
MGWAQAEADGNLPNIPIPEAISDHYVDLWKKEQEHRDRRERFYNRILTEQEDKIGPSED